jgi:hypothetical protein
MQCHTQNDSNYFSTRTDFKPFVSPIAFAPPVTQSNRYTEVAPKEAKYLPGERLLIKLGTDRKKEKKKNYDVDVDRITKSLSRVLAGF